MKIRPNACRQLKNLCKLGLRPEFDLRTKCDLFHQVTHYRTWRGWPHWPLTDMTRGLLIGGGRTQCRTRSPLQQHLAHLNEACKARALRDDAVNLSVCLSVCSSVVSAGKQQPCRVATATKGVPYVSSPVKNSPHVTFIIAAGAYSWNPWTRHICYNLLNDKPVRDTKLLTDEKCCWSSLVISM